VPLVLPNAAVQVDIAGMSNILNALVSLVNLNTGLRAECERNEDLIKQLSWRAQNEREEVSEMREDRVQGSPEG